MFSAGNPDRFFAGRDGCPLMMREGTSSTAERVWIIISGILLLAAAVSVWWNNLSAAFVAAALGACAWFLSYRARLTGAASKDHETEDDETNTEVDSD